MCCARHICAAVARTPRQNELELSVGRATQGVRATADLLGESKVGKAFFADSQPSYCLRPTVAFSLSLLRVG